MTKSATRTSLILAAMLSLIFATGCENYPWLGIYGSTTAGGTTTTGGGGSTAFPTGATFTENLVQERTFVDGKGVKTVTYQVDDMTRTPVFIDFNNDGHVDPVAAYLNDDQGVVRGVVQILLSSDGAADGEVEFLSLTLDGGGNPWRDLQDAAVGDIDNDGGLDLAVATGEGVVYLHHPGPGNTTVLRDWGADAAGLELIDGTTEMIDDDELLAIVVQALGPTVDLDNYIVTVEQGYTAVAIADFDNDGENDICASRRLVISLEPVPGVELPPVQIVTGNIQVLENPGLATTGAGWTSTPIADHERHDTPDRDGSAGLFPYDVDGDGDLDIVSAARKDNNVQVAWFENPGGQLDTETGWMQWRVGSLRDAWAIDVADLTGDGLVDVVATGPSQMQMLLFEQPADGPKRDYDWDTHVIASFQSIEPYGVLAVDFDNDDELELVLGGTEGAVRYFEAPDEDPTQTWIADVITDFNPSGTVGLLGHADLDGDGDLDLVAVVDDAATDNNDRIAWIRNELATGL